MTIQSFLCDRCGEPIREHRTLLHTATGPLKQHHPSIDLCRMCGADLARWLSEGPAVARELEAAMAAS